MRFFCRNALATGTCPQEASGCIFRHEVRKCDICDLYMDPGNWDSHAGGKKHRQRLQSAPLITNSPERQRTSPSAAHAHIPATSTAGRSQHILVASNSATPQSIRCDACGIFLSNSAAYRSHRNSLRHKVAFDKLISGTGTGSNSQGGHHPPPSGRVHCEVCNIDVEERLVEGHQLESRHLRRKRAAEMDEAFMHSQRNTSTISVSDESGVDFGTVDSNGTLEPLATSRFVKIEKTNRNARIALKKVSLHPHVASAGSEASFTAKIVGDARWVNFGRPVSVEVQFKPAFSGRHNAIMELTFHSVIDNQVFTIVRALRALAVAEVDHERIRPSAPYSRPTFIKPVDPTNIHPRRRPVVWSNVKWKKTLPEFKVPADLVEAAFGGGRPLRVRTVQQQFMPHAFDIDSYAKYFHVCLYIEEEQQRINLAQMAMHGTLVVPDHPYYTFTIPNKADLHRVKVVVGNTILFQHSDSPDSTWYPGVVHRIVKDDIGPPITGRNSQTRGPKVLKLRFDSAFSTYRGNKFTAQYELNRMPFRRYHQAVEDVSSLERLLFPSEVNVRDFSRRDGVAFFNRDIGNNVNQSLAVNAITAMSPGCVPFVIFGPPGTGKTSTVVETIRQIFYSTETSCVLACAPSNTAADLLAKKLLDIGKTNLLRLCAFSREVEEIESDIKDVVRINIHDMFDFPILHELKKFRVIVCTCVSSGVLRNLGLRRGHFSHIFIDEAGRSHEPEAMIPIQMADDTTNIILCGDPLQLRPRVDSVLADQLGLKKSYLERLVDVYKKRNRLDRARTERDAPSVHLREHYRSHPDIIAFCNAEFYNGELIARGDPAITNSLLNRDVLVNKQFPIVFHGISGKDEREGSSPSFFNRVEAVEVKRYVSQLMDDRKLRLLEEHIGVITPYFGQCCKIKGLLEEWPGIKVGSVEEFQGQERRVIIISTVRSNADHISFDLRHNLGFVADKSRFNVAITRAQALLIVIGDPIVLSLDPLWRKFMNYVHLKGGWRGKKIDWDPNESTTSEGFDQRRRTDATSAVERLVERTRPRTLEELRAAEGEEAEEEWEAFMDRGWGNVE